jgi:hypothetical protein
VGQKVLEAQLMRAGGKQNDLLKVGVNLLLFPPDSRYYKHQKKKLIEAPLP